MKLKLNPIQKTTTTLLLLALGAVLANPRLEVAIHLATTLIFTLVLFFILKKITQKNKNLHNSIISSLIIFLLINYIGPGNSATIYTLTAILISTCSKFFLEPKGLPIINPAVLGLLASYGISKIPGMPAMLISWWGTNYQFHIPLALTIIALWTIMGLKSWRKWSIFFSFLISHAILNFALNQNLELLKFIFSDGTIYFFTAIMLIEPKSSPILKKQQVFYGIIAALAYNAGVYAHVPNFDLWSIAIANVSFFIIKNLKTPQIAKTNV